MNILVSACLVGINCNYKATNKQSEAVLSLKDRFNLIPFCPEQAGGMSTPRIPSEIKDDKVINKNGEDVTTFFERGANECLKVAKLYNCKYAILKSNSPSCGKNKVYDGTFSQTLVDGMGVTAKLLQSNGIEIFTEDEVDKLLLLCN